MFIVYMLLVAAPFSDTLLVDFDKEITQEVWALKPDERKRIYDAIVVRDATRVGRSVVKRYRKVRIFSESGKAAAEFNDSLGGASNLKGRVIDRSGLQTTFDGDTDMVEVLLYRTKDEREQSKILVPPGLTSDCVVEYSWELPAKNGLPEGYYVYYYPVRDDFFTLEKVFQVPRNYQEGYNLTSFTWTKPGDPAQYEQGTNGGLNEVIFKRITPKPYHPFSSDYLGEPLYLQSFKSIYGYPTTPVEFWKKISEEYLGEQVFPLDFKRSKGVRQWVNGLRRDMPSGAKSALAFIANDLRTRFKVTDVSTEVSERRKLVNKIFDQGSGTSAELTYLFLVAALDCGIHVKLLYVNSLYDVPFVPVSMMPFALNYHSPMFVVEDGGQFIPFSPQRKGWPLGYVPESYRGSQGFSVDPLTWKYRFLKLPRSQAHQHGLNRSWQTQVAQDGSMKFTMTRKGKGGYLVTTYRRYAELPQEERDLLLRSRWNARLDDWNITSAVVNLADQVEGETNLVIEAQSLPKPGDFLLLDVFPGELLPMRVPRIWPQNRTTPFVLPAKGYFIDTNTITLPPGWRLQGPLSWTEQNSVGSVAYEVVQEGNVITVRREVNIEDDRPDLIKENDVKAFVNWMHEAYFRYLDLSKGEM